MTSQSISYIKYRDQYKTGNEIHLVKWVFLYILRSIRPRP